MATTTESKKRILESVLRIWFAGNVLAERVSLLPFPSDAEQRKKVALECVEIADSVVLALEGTINDLIKEMKDDDWSG